MYQAYQLHKTVGENESSGICFPLKVVVVVVVGGHFYIMDVSERSQSLKPSFSKITEVPSETCSLQIFTFSSSKNSPCVKSCRELESRLVWRLLCMIVWNRSRPRTEAETSNKRRDGATKIKLIRQGFLTSRESQSTVKDLYQQGCCVSGDASVPVTLQCSWFTEK